MAHKLRYWHIELKPMSQLRLPQRRVVVAQPSGSTSRYNAASVIERISAANATVFAGSFRSARAAAIRASNDAASRRSSARVRAVGVRAH
jgi:hypothetical protein